MQMTDFIVFIGEWSADILASTVYILYIIIISYYHSVIIQRIEKETFARLFIDCLCF